MCSVLLGFLFGIRMAAGPMSASSHDDHSALDRIRARKRLLVSVKNDGVPSPSLHKDPAHFQKRGFETDLARAIARKLLGDAGRVELRIFPRRERLRAVESGKVDLVISMIPITDATLREVDLSTPYLEGGLFLLLPMDSKARGLRDLQGQGISAVHAHAKNQAEELASIATRQSVTISVDPQPDLKSALQALRRGRTSAIAGQYADVKAFLENESGAGLKLAPEPLRHDRFAVAVRKGETDLLAAVNGIIADLRSKGELKRMAARWRLASFEPAPAR